MRDIYSMEYTELSNAPHFIFNGQHTQDFFVTNVLADSGLAKETFLPNRSLVTEKTRYSDKAYLLGYNEEPLTFKIRLLFDEHKLTQQNLMALRRWLYTTTYKELKFDNEEESNMNILVYAIVTGTSELSHNVINDGYIDLEFTTNSSRRYSEIMEEYYDFTKSATEKLLDEYQNEFSTLSLTLEEIGKKLKQYVARTNYANIEEFFKDDNSDKIPDGWKLISGNTNDITWDNESKRINLNNVHIRKRFNGNNGRNYYMRVHGKNGKIKIHEEDFDVNTMGVHQFKFRRNLLGHHGTFDLDSSRDGIGEGWSKQGIQGDFTLNTEEEAQVIKNSGTLISPITISSNTKYVVIAKDINRNSEIRIGSNISKNTTSSVNKMKFIGDIRDRQISIKQANPSKDTKLSHIRVYKVTDKEYEDFDNLSDAQLLNAYPYFDDHAYFDIDFSSTSGYIDYIDMWELNDLNKKKLDSGTPIEKLVYFDYENYTKILDKFKQRLDSFNDNNTETFDKLSRIQGINVDDLHNKTTLLLEKIIEELSLLYKGDNMKLYQWDDMQPHYLKFKEYASEISPIIDGLYEYIKLNQHLIDGSYEIGTDIITVFNYGDKYVYPTFVFESRDGSDIMVRNKDTGEQTLITDNIPGETIRVVGSSEKIYSSRPEPYYKYNAHDDVFLRLKVGYNDLEFSGNYRVKIIYQFVLL